MENDRITVPIRTARASQLARAPDERPDLLMPLEITEIRWVLQYDEDLRCEVSDRIVIIYRVPKIAHDMCECVRRDAEYGLRLFAKIRELRFVSGGMIPLKSPITVKVADIILPNKDTYPIIAVSYRIGEVEDPLLKEASEAFHTYLIS